MTTTIKTCFKCKVEQPIANFYVHPAMGDGRLNKCKECTKADVAKNYKDNIDHYKEYEKFRATIPCRVQARREYQATETGKAAGNRAKKNYIRKNPLKRSAHFAVDRAIKNFILIKSPCEICGNENVHAHHDDYSKPLDVRWLCTKHHAEWHKHNKALCPDQGIAA